MLILLTYKVCEIMKLLKLMNMDKA